jgi:molybdopterin converting factor small subunit
VVIRIYIHGSLARHFAGKGADSGNGMAVKFLQKKVSTAQILNRLRISEEVVGFVAINGVRTAKDTWVTDGDEVAIFPLVTGG